MRCRIENHGNAANIGNIVGAVADKGGF